MNTPSSETVKRGEVRRGTFLYRSLLTRRATGSCRSLPTPRTERVPRWLREVGRNAACTRLCRCERGATGGGLVTAAVPASTVQRLRDESCSQAGGRSIVLDITDIWASSGTILNPPFVAGVEYRFQVCAVAGIQTLCTPAVPLLTQFPALTGALFDGESVKVTWSAPSNPLVRVSGYRVELSSPNSDVVYTREIWNPLAAEALVTLDDDFEASWPWKAVVSALVEPRVTASTPAASLFLSQPELTAATYVGAEIQASWNGPGISGPVTGYVISAWSRRGGPSFESAVIPAGTTSGSVPLSGPLDPSGQYMLNIVARTGGGIDSSTTAVALIAEIPEIVEVGFDGVEALTRWTPVLSVDAPASGVQLKSLVTGGGGATTTVPFNNPMVDEASVGVPEPDKFQYAVQVCATAGMVLSCSATLALVQQTTSITSAMYNGAVVEAVWKPLNGITDYFLQLCQHDFVMAEQRLAGASGSIPYTLGGTDGWTVRVRAASGASVGPAVSAPLVTAAPEVATIFTDPVTEKTTIAWHADPGAASYLVQLYENGLPSGSPKPASTTTYDLPDRLQADADLAVAMPLCLLLAI